jgi:two-component system cell cycle response regulator DivK
MGAGNMEEPKKTIPRKILVVDDNQDSRELAVKVLRNKGYQIVEAVDGEDALEKAITEKPHLILLDISIPKMTGYEVAGKLKSMEEFENIPIVALTAHAMKGDREKFITCGFEGYISKPINVREFPEQVRAYLRGKWESVIGG